MNVKRWHIGKVVMVWAWGAVIVVVLLHFLREKQADLQQHVLLGFVVLALIFAIPIALSILTWRWLTGREEAAAKAARTTPPE